MTNSDFEIAYAIDEIIREGRCAVFYVSGNKLALTKVHWSRDGVVMGEGGNGKKTVIRFERIDAIQEAEADL